MTDKMKQECRSPSHYTSGSIECIDYIKDRVNAVPGISHHEAFLWANIMRYNHRLFEKDSVRKNAEKIRVYLDLLEMEIRENDIKEEMESPREEPRPRKELRGETREEIQQGVYLHGQEEVPIPRVQETQGGKA
jgi:exopolyphosphatase/pppGpp-phosphohydrolase